jgi:hypothetical protein
MYFLHPLISVKKDAVQVHFETERTAEQYQLLVCNSLDPSTEVQLLSWIGLAVQQISKQFVYLKQLAFNFNIRYGIGKNIGLQHFMFVVPVTACLSPQLSKYSLGWPSAA